MRRDGERGNRDAFLSDRKHPARAHGRYALGAGFTLMRRVAIDDRLALLGGIVLSVVYSHERDGAAQTVSPRNMLTTSDMPNNGVNVIMAIPPVAFVRVSPSM
jgi:hypothetical protein